MSRPARPLDPRKAQRLRDVAAAAFGIDGLDGASLNDILRRSAMGKSSFYHHFESKAQLHDWVTEQLASRLFTDIRPPQLGEITAEDFRPELTAFLYRFGQIAMDRPELMALGRMFHNSAEASQDRAISRVRHQVLAWITGSLATGRALGVIRSDLPSDLLGTWVVASLTAIDQWVLTAASPLTIRQAEANAALEALWRLLTDTTHDPSRPHPADASAQV